MNPLKVMCITATILQGFIVLVLIHVWIWKPMSPVLTNNILEEITTLTIGAFATGFVSTYPGWKD